MLIRWGLQYMNNIIIRCSSLDRVFQCAHSLRLPTFKAPSTYAADGTEKHDRISTILTILSTLSGKDDIKIDEDIKPYIDYIRALNLSVFHVEKKLTHDYKDIYTLSGTPDIFGRIKQTLYVIDYKSGFQSVLPTSLQLQGYAYLILKNKLFNRVREIKLIIFQNDEPEELSLDRNTILKLGAQLSERIKRWTYARGAHCQFCESKLNCKLMMDDVKALLVDDKNISRLEDIEKNKTYLTQLIKDNHHYLLKLHPDKFFEKSRQKKVWKKGYEKPYSVSKALGLGEEITQDVEYEIETSTSWAYRAKR